jgi:transposase
MKKYFTNPKNLTHRHFEALKAHYIEGVPLADLAKIYGLSLSYLMSARNKYSKLLKMGIDPFFQDKKPGPKSRHKVDTMREQIVSLRKQNYSVLDIKAALEACDQKVSHPTIAQVLREEGFVRLPRRSFQEKNQLTVPTKIQSPRTATLVAQKEEFSTGRSGGVLSFLPLMEELGIIDAIRKAGYPETSEISSVSYVLSFLALKLLGNKRFSHDESWALDRVLGLFSGLNVLPKSSSLSSYSYRVSRSCNRNLLIELSRIFNSTEEPCEFNLDFKSIPHWGDESLLEKNYSTIRGKAVKSVLSLIVQNVTTDHNI